MVEGYYTKGRDGKQIRFVDPPVVRRPKRPPLEDVEDTSDEEEVFEDAEQLEDDKEIKEDDMTDGNSIPMPAPIPESGVSAPPGTSAAALSGNLAKRILEAGGSIFDAIHSGLREEVTDAWDNHYQPSLGGVKERVIKSLMKGRVTLGKRKTMAARLNLIKKAGRLREQAKLVSKAVRAGDLPADSSRLVTRMRARAKKMESVAKKTPRKKSARRRWWGKKRWSNWRRPVVIRGSGRPTNFNIAN